MSIFKFPKKSSRKYLILTTTITNKSQATKTVETKLHNHQATNPVIKKIIIKT